jgi:ATP-binding cassette subfamily B protein
MTATDSLARSLWQRLAPVLAEYRGRVSLALACLLAAKGGLLLIPFLLKALVDGLDAAGTPTLLLLLLVLAYGGARFANTLFGELRDTLFGRVTERAMRRIGLQVFRHVHSLDLDYHLNRRTGGLARDIERGVSGISFLLRFFIFNIAPTLFEIGMVAGILLFSYGASYAAIVLVSVLVYAIYSFRATAWRTRYVREMNEADSHSNTRAVDSLLNYETVKYFTNETFEAERYDQSLAEWEEARRRNRLSLFALNGGQALIIALAQMAMLALAALQVQDGRLSLGDFVLINQFMLQLFMPLGFLGFVYREIKASLANIETLFDLLAIEPAVRDQPDAPPLPAGPGDISFENVSFAYGSGRPVLTGLDLQIAAGETVAVVGASGAGKSTLVKLLFRFYDPDSGAVRVNGVDIRSVQQQSLRERIAIVPQDCVLFNASLEDNIRYGRPTASDEEVAAAVRAAHLDDFVARLPEGLATRVGERGLKLSGGEKQRVAIARAVLKAAPILVFDEATSSLDSRSEQAVLAAFRELAGEHPALVIAHRLSTVVDADRIVVLQDGRVVEQGRHHDLVNANSYYSQLWQAQQRQRDET